MLVTTVCSQLMRKAVPALCFTAIRQSSQATEKFHNLFEQAKLHAIGLSEKLPMLFLESLGQALIFPTLSYVYVCTVIVSHRTQNGNFVLLSMNSRPNLMS